MAVMDLGRVMPINKGNYSSSTSYEKMDVVSYGGSSYWCISPCQGIAPTNTTYWAAIAYKGDDGDNAYQPFKGWFVSSSSLGSLFPSPQVGDYAFIKGTTSTDPITIYECNTEGVWEDSTRDFNPAYNQSFASGEEVNTVHIVDNLASSNSADVLSAKQGKVLDEKVGLVEEEMDKAPTTDNTSAGDLEFSDDNIPANVILRCENGHIRTKYFYSGDVYTKTEVNALIGGGEVTQEELNSALNTKQDKLTSGTNIKTVNGVSLLGSGNIEVAPRTHLKLVVIGNSYSADSFMYVPFILLNYGITIELGVYHRGGASLQNQVDEWSTGNGSASFWFINTKTQSAWQVISSNYSPKQAIDYNTWDIITIQQGSIASVDYANYTTAARSLINLITNEVGYPYTLAWNININRDSSGSDYTAIANQILSNINNICQREPVNLIFPYGTAIFNARTNSTLNAIGDGGSLYASDKVHLQEGLPCYIAAITNVQTLFNRFYPTLSVLNDSVGANITQTRINNWGVKGQQGTCTGISASNCRLAQICAVLANRFNFEIKTIY